MGEHADEHHCSLPPLPVYHWTVLLRKVTDLRESNSILYSHGLLHVVIVFWKGCLSIKWCWWPEKCICREMINIPSFCCLVDLKRLLNNSKAHSFVSDAGNGEVMQIFDPLVLNRFGIPLWKLGMLHLSCPFNSLHLTKVSWLWHSSHLKPYRGFTCLNVSLYVWFLYVIFSWLFILFLFVF